MSTDNNTNALTGMEWRVKLVNWVKTTRVQTAMVTALALWIGYVTVAPLDIESAILLGVIGLLVHLWGFTLNEVEDYKYDAKMGDVEGHPIAQGKVHAGLARYFAWVSALAAVGISVLTSIWATVVLLLSFIPGYMYDKWSKKHWWSNFYLSGWAFIMVLSGATYAGEITGISIAIAIAVSIQIFTQVIEGDLKDIEGPENTLAEKLGVYVSGDTLYFTKRFTGIVYGLKAVEATMLIGVVIYIADGIYISSLLYYLVLTITLIVFIVTVTLFMSHTADRDEIKEKSSIHELSSILFLGASVYHLDPHGAVLIAIAPILWYISVNHIIHSSALNPDI